MVAEMGQHLIERLPPGSVAGYLAGGFGEKLREVQAPTVFVLGASSPMPAPAAPPAVSPLVSATRNQESSS